MAKGPAEKWHHEGGVVRLFLEMTIVMNGLAFHLVLVLE
jgi:hypothetical protein